MIIQKLPSQYKPVIGNSEYSASYGVVNPNRYVFENNEASKKSFGINVKNGNLYYIDVLNVSSNINQSEYVQAVDVLPKLTFRYSTGSQLVYPKPITIRTLFENAPLSFWFYHDQADTVLQSNFYGSFYQTANMIGLTDLIVTFQIFTYEITDKQYIDEWRNEKPDSYYKGMS